jgi:hypothetical protein
LERASSRWAHRKEEEKEEKEEPIMMLPTTITQRGGRLGNRQLKKSPLTGH